MVEIRKQEDFTPQFTTGASKKWGMLKTNIPSVGTSGIVKTAMPVEGTVKSLVPHEGLEIRKQRAYAPDRLKFQRGCSRPFRPEVSSEIGAFLFVGNNPSARLSSGREAGGRFPLDPQARVGLCFSRHIAYKFPKEVSHDQRTVKPLVVFSYSIISQPNSKSTLSEGGFPMSQSLMLHTLGSKIHHLEGHEPFMLISDLAELYEASIEQINQAIRRNPRKFPTDFIFELSYEEKCKLRSEGYISSKAIARRMRGLTHFGCNALGSCLKTRVADMRSVQIIRAFTAMEQGERSQPSFKSQTYPSIVLGGLELKVLKTEAGEHYVLSGAYERYFQLRRGAVRDWLGRTGLDAEGSFRLCGPALREIRRPMGLYRAVNIVSCVRLNWLVRITAQLVSERTARQLSDAMRGLDVLEEKTSTEPFAELLAD